MKYCGYDEYWYNKNYSSSNSFDNNDNNRGSNGDRPFRSSRNDRYDNNRGFNRDYRGNNRDNRDWRNNNNNNSNYNNYGNYNNSCQKPKYTPQESANYWRTRYNELKSANSQPNESNDAAAGEPNNQKNKPFVKKK